MVMVTAVSLPEHSDRLMSPMKIILAILFVLLVLLQVKLWRGDGGIVDTLQRQQAVDHQVQENNSLSERNQALEAEVNDLKQGVDAIEERARSELGLIKPGETFFQTVDE
ncbi:Cell division protein DivIC (FtsB), stabilizes FtsL against RasP cleavage [hydrothermal vent metagenome]|uniref:Cell division protein DivIC (FtsB), stabilizes FtsL against RasP cleavage n=1 Tax=hydrothermal vent metagenome TaxID=652676 RepID=A0A3B0ZEL7_9ZZZZ